MFRRTTKNLPADRSFPVSLPALGLRINSANQIVTSDRPADGTDDFFDYFYSSDERTNDNRKEAVHESVRQIVLDKLQDLDIHQLYLSEDQVLSEKPSEATPTINILATAVFQLKTANDVIVIVGEHTDDLGIWSWRSAMSEPGLNQATAVGLAHMLKIWSNDSSRYAEERNVTNLEGPTALTATPDTSSTTNNAPVVIILNPGELIWSHKANKNISQRTLLARPRKPFYQQHYGVDAQYNRVKGHASPDEHVTTFLTSILPKLTKPTSNLYFIAIGGGSEAVMTWLDGVFSADADDPASPRLPARLQALALLQPSFQGIQITNERFRRFCADSDRVARWDVFVRPESGEGEGEGEARAEEQETDVGYCPTFGVGPGIELVEMMLPNLLPGLLRWFSTFSSATTRGTTTD